MDRMRDLSRSSDNYKNYAIYILTVEVIFNLIPKN